MEKGYNPGCYKLRNELELDKTDGLELENEIINPWGGAESFVLI